MGRILLTISLRNLLAHKTSSFIVGSIIFFGTFLVVLGTSMLDSMNRSMSKSIISSIAGHLQLYAADAKDDLSLFGGFMGGDDYGVIHDFDTVRREVEALPNVAAVVPMGIQAAIVMQGNEIDLTLSSLRSAVEAKDSEGVAALKQKLINLAEDLVTDLENRFAIAADQEAVKNGLRDLARVQSEAFWDEFGQKPEDSLLFLDTNLAPLAEDGRIYYLRNLGTDVHRFTKLFDRFELVEGEMIPEGERGILLSSQFYEDQVKHRVAWAFDRIHTGITETAKTIEGDAVLKDMARRLPRQYPRIKNQLSAADAQVLIQELSAMFPDKPRDLAELLQEFLTVNDDNFMERHDAFYRLIAPKLRLYGLPIGDTFTVRTVTKSGYLKSVKIKVWGTYRFKGLEKSDLAGAQNLLDMITFRELFGVMSQETKAELEGIKDEVGVADIARSAAEDALFGGGDVDGGEAGTQEHFNVEERMSAREVDEPTRYTQADIDRGLAINAAVILNDDSRLEETKAAITALSEEKDLGLQVMDWQTAAGIVGQFIVLSRIVLYVAIFIIFVVALVIINNSMVMATLERTPEIGTMRAMGAQRRLVLGMFLMETSLLGLLAGTGGAIAGAALVQFLGNVGVPAPNDFMVFLFSGPRLFPTFGAWNLIFGFVVVLLVSLASTFYPARIAASIQPVVAMQPKE